MFPPCSTSRFIERQIFKSILKQFFPEDAEAKLSCGCNSAAQLMETLTVRVTSRLPRTTTMGPRLKRWVQEMDSTAPTAFAHTSKVISLFQRIDNADVLLFVLYVQEYDADAPTPNTRSVYIAYLDSINIMTPRALRSIVYKQMVGSYICWAKVNGYRRVYIWSCPPTKNQNYALHCHPPSQRTPDSYRLRRWYGHIIQNLTLEGVVLRSTTLHEAHFSEHKPFVATRRRRQNRGVDGSSSSGTAVLKKDHCDSQAPEPASGGCANGQTTVRINVPVFAGDFWPAQAEIIIREYLECPTAGIVDQTPNMRKWWQRLLRETGRDTEPKSEYRNEGSGTPSSKTLLSWLMSRLATRVAGMNRHFMVLDLVVECAICGKGRVSHSASLENWVCQNRGCRYTLCPQCVQACGGKPSSIPVPELPNPNCKRNSRIPPLLLPANATRLKAYRKCTCDAIRGGRHRFVREVLPATHLQLLRAAEKLQGLTHQAHNDDFLLPNASYDTEHAKQTEICSQSKGCFTPKTIVPVSFSEASFDFLINVAPSCSPAALEKNSHKRKISEGSSVVPIHKVPKICEPHTPERLNHSLRFTNGVIRTVDRAQLQPLSTVFDSRSMFLWFCQKHHLQFDQLRRARFSTQMIFRNLRAPIVPVKPLPPSSV